ncbi:MAG: hypothetical protein JSW65_06520 [Candidatus Bipolaricaulota bacterium]|nr:MAG: hypothetical protein JSW65_06520 [Candidatus Bipolaricaulota bacterium]
MHALVYWVATREAEVHYLDAIISAYDGMANVRRDFILKDAKAYYKVYVSEGMEDEFLEIAERLRAEGAIDDLFRGDPEGEGSHAVPDASEEGTDGVPPAG